MHSCLIAYTLGLVAILLPTLAVASAPALGTQLIASGLNRPLLVTAPPGDSTRLFIVEQTGRILVHDGQQILATPFLDISGSVSCCGEEGLLGLAFHPDYESNGYFFINYTTTSGGRKTVVRRHKVSSDANLANADSFLTIIEVGQPNVNHNGGMIAFGPTDGMLYIGMGDGGGFSNPPNNSQDESLLLGKMLRIDINSPGSGKNYGIPADNPYVNVTDTLPEIWAFGLRNPWRFSFDRQTADMYIADVGQTMVEEINFQPAASAGGENYGWRLKEGLNCFNPATNCDTLNFVTDPITQYLHQNGRCSITGGFVYRGCAIPELSGTYFYADWCSREVWSFNYDGVNIIDSVNRTAELGININVTSFGEDGAGELYIIGSGQVHKIVPVGQPLSCSPASNCCVGKTGNIDDDLSGIIDIADLTFLIDNLFINFTPIPCPAAGNIDGDSSGTVDIADLTFLIDHLFVNFVATADCQ